MDLFRNPYIYFECTPEKHSGSVQVITKELRLENPVTQRFILKSIRKFPSIVHAFPSRLFQIFLQGNFRKKNQVFLQALERSIYISLKIAPRISSKIPLGILSAISRWILLANLPYVVLEIPPIFFFSK